MGRNYKNIAVLEPSQIVYEGLAGIFAKADRSFQLLRTESLSEIQNLASLGRFELAIINPSQIQNRNKEFAAIKKNNNGINWIALVYNYFEPPLLALFDNVISLTDSPELIIRQIKNLVNANSSSAHDSDQEPLSDREIDVLKLMVKGFSNKEIADNLNISIHTVISHRKNISQKTGIKSQSGLTIYAISNKIVLIEEYSKLI